MGLLCMVTTLCASAQASDRNAFKAVLAKHLHAITERNLPNIAATVADSVTLIFPDGEVLKSRQKFIAFHEEWFKDTTWKMTTEVVRVTESKTLAYALVKYRYEKQNENGTAPSSSETYLLLIFEKQTGGWKLLHDQNTRIGGQ